MVGKGLILTISQFNKLALISSRAIHDITIVKILYSFLSFEELKEKEKRHHPTRPPPPYC